MRRLLLFLICAAVLVAETTSDSAAYSVAYFEILPASRAVAIAAMKQYREASRKDAGFRRIELFEQVGRPGHFCVIETWASSKDLDAHDSSATAKDFHNHLDSLRLSDYDQRPYKALSLGNTRPGEGTFVITHVDVGGPGADPVTLLRNLAEASRKEAGNLRFDIVQHAARANHFTVIEEWRSTKDVEAHAAAAHTKEYRRSLGPITGSPLDERIYKIVE